MTPLLDCRCSRATSSLNWTRFLSITNEKSSRLRSNSACISSSSARIRSIRTSIWDMGRSSEHWLVLETALSALGPRRVVKEGLFRSHTTLFSDGLQRAYAAASSRTRMRMPSTSAATSPIPASGKNPPIKVGRIVAMKTRGPSA